jgi:endothelin-converting enzyme/putative endopeptidase
MSQNIKKMFTSALCSSLLLVTSCSNDIQNNDTRSSDSLNSTSAPLLSGIDKQNMDISIRPQDNFYRYINGGWLKNTTIPADKTSIGSFYDLRDEADDNVKRIIEELAATPNLVLGSDEQKVADLFRSYMNIEQRNKLGITPISSLLTKIKSLKNKDQLAAFFGQYQSVGIDSPLGFYVSVDAKDSSRYATHVWQSGLGLPDKDYYVNDSERFVKLRAGYLNHIESMFRLAGLTEGKKAASTVMTIETKLANYHWTRVETRDSDKRYNKFKVSELNSLTDTFNWQAYLTAQGVAKQKDLIINQPSYIEGLGKVFAETSLADWQTYLTFHTLSNFSGVLTTSLDNENFDFYAKQLSGRNEQRPMWKRGVAVVNNNLGEVIGKVYVSRHFTPEAKSRMNQLVENLRDAYGKSITELDWMSEATKQAAQVKLALFDPKIGYPNKWRDYSALEIKADDLVGNMIRSGKTEHEKEIAKLGGAIDKQEWAMTPQTVNAYYNPTKNEIVFPAAILQPPFFNLAADDAVNYGGIGAVIGHEMGHGFDDQGSKYDGEGNLRNWWTEEDLSAFKQRADNLVEQYNKYAVFDDLTVNGKLTLGENIGDLSGVTIAYKAYKASLNGKQAPVIDDLTGDQRFFIGYTQIWRSKMVEKSMRNRVATDSHSPGEFRALGSLSNMPEFYKAFNVKAGDAMYIAPENRVKIW